MKYSCKIKLWLFWLLVATGTSFAQQLPSLSSKSFFMPIMPCSKGVYLMPLANGRSTGENPFSKIKKYIVYKSENGRGYKKIVELSFPKSWEEFESRIGKVNADGFARKMKTHSHEEAYEQIHRFNKEKLGFYLLSKKFLAAIGVMYLDEGPYSLNTKYKIEAVQINGTPTTIVEQNIPPIQINNWEKPTSLKREVSDSLVSLQWKTISINEEVFVANIYRRVGSQGRFELLPMHLLKGHNPEYSGDFFQVTDQVKPETIYEYFIVPTDFAGNEGPASDTVKVMSVSISKIKGIKNLLTKDSAGGVLLSWEQLPTKGYFTGIVVSKSRSPFSGFVTLDTIQSTLNHYFDRTSLPGTQYYYQVQALVYPFAHWKPLVPTMASIVTKGNPQKPLPPTGLLSFHQGKNIKLKWDNNTETDLFAYYVYRGTSVQNLELISGPVRDTIYVDSAASLSGASEYVYSVVAANKNQKWSAFAHTTAIKPNRMNSVAAVGGLNLIYYPEGLKLVWEDILKSNPTLIGYLVFKKQVGEKSFQLISKSSIDIPTFVDSSQSKNPVNAEYTVAPIDAWGNIGILSPVITFSQKKRILPPAIVYGRQNGQMVEISWPISALSNPNVGFNIYRKKISDKYYKLLGTTKSNKWVDKSIPQSGLYQYAISVVMGTEESTKSKDTNIRWGH